MCLKITNMEEPLLDSVIAFCNLHYINYQRFTTGKDRVYQCIKVNIVNDDLIMLLSKIFNEYDRYDFGTIQIM